ncbi:MAG: ABC transporter ATP-binding protein [Calditrichaeota bacterium]|nr:MAG: ABC transporter ATP-binding protein [Calditrichota bacterium]
MRLFPFPQLFALLNPRHQRKIFLLIGFILTNATLEVVSLASILPFIVLLLNPALIKEAPYIQTIYESFPVEQNPLFWVVLVGMLSLLFLLKNGAQIALTHYQSRFIYDVATNLSQREYEKFFRRAFPEVLQEDSSHSVRNILFLPIEFSVYVLLSAVTLFSELAVFALIILGIAWYNLQILLLLVMVLIPPFLLLRFLKKDLFRKVGKISETLRPRTLQQVYQGVQSFIEVKLYGKEKFFIRRLIDELYPLHRNYALFNTLSAVPPRLIETAMVLGLGVIVLFAVFTNYPSQKLILLLSLFVTAAYRVMPSLNRIVMSWMNMKTYGYTTQLLSAHLQPNSPYPNKPRKVEPLSFEREIRFSNIGFHYSSRNDFTLKEITFTIKKGEFLGIIGESGAGKTTLLNILLRFLKEDSGEFFIDGKPLLEEQIPDWHGLIGYVQQHPLILNSSIAENVAYGEDEIDTRKVEDSLRLSGLGDFLSQLPHGVNTMLGEKGAELSGGQTQRLAIARALYRNAQILIFDEATSELDQGTEEEVVNAIHQLVRKEGVTVVMVTHRISALKHCDRIIELKGGKITNEYQFSQLPQ